MNITLESALLECSEERAILLQQLTANPEGLVWCERHSACMDKLFDAVAKSMRSERPELPALCLVATGGYGRRELAPYSDLDVFFVPEIEASAALDQALRDIFRWFTDRLKPVLGISVGYSYLLLSDLPGADAKTRTALLDARRLAGDRTLFKRLTDQSLETLPVGEFLVSKIRERREQEARFHRETLVVEPHLKEGAGGLRAFQAANWIRIAMGERGTKATAAYDHVALMRNLLHVVSARPNDALQRPKQAEIAEHLGLDVYDMMGDLARSREELQNDFEQALERIQEARFGIGAAATAARGELRVIPGSDAGDAAISLAIGRDLGLRVEGAAFQSKSVNGSAALHAISRGEGCIRDLARAGILAALLPELEQCRFLMPRDASHAYTVYEHTLKTVGAIEQLGQSEGPMAELFASLTHPGKLYLAALLHDVGKAIEGRPHSETGAEIALEVCARWGLSEETTQSVSRLVREHLTLSKLIRLRDVALPETTEELLAIGGDLDELNMLALLTCADIQSVAPGLWTPSLEGFLLELLARARSVLEGRSPTIEEPEDVRHRLLRSLRGEAADPEEIREFLDRLPAHYIAGASAEEIRLHMKYAQRALEGEPVVDAVVDPRLSLTKLTICARDSQGLLAKALGTFYALDVSVLAIKATTTQGPNPVALDEFSIALHGHPVPPGTLRILRSTLYEVLKGEQTVERALSEHGKDPDRTQHILRTRFVPGDVGVLEINAPRGRGMPYRIARMLSKQGWNVVSARVGQWAGNGAAAFYIVGPQGQLVTPEEVRAVFPQ